MSEIDSLQELLKKLPGIGPRQARRFAFFLLAADSGYIQRLISGINSLREEKSICQFCNRVYFDKKNRLCFTCRDTSRDQHKVLVIEKNSDFENFEKSGVWNGRYYLLLKNITVLEESPEKRLTLTALKTNIESGDVTEIVTALAVNPDGEFTTEYVYSQLKEYVSTHKLHISSLGRGLSTGSEIEYADSETLKQALENRK